jgi:hypothetical protein
MNGWLKILSLIVLVTLIFAIARQLSEQTELKRIPHSLYVNHDDGFKRERKNIYLLPDSFGTPFANKGWDQGKRARM